jgi:hypothetical protein
MGHPVKNPSDRQFDFRAAAAGRIMVRIDVELQQLSRDVGIRPHNIRSGRVQLRFADQILQVKKIHGSFPSSQRVRQVPGSGFATAGQEKGDT